MKVLQDPAAIQRYVLNTWLAAAVDVDVLEISRASREDDECYWLVVAHVDKTPVSLLVPPWHHWGELGRVQEVTG